MGELSWFVNAYTLTFATLMLAAALGDRLGRRRVMISGASSLFTLASIASALSTTADPLIAARAVQGLGAAAIMPLSLPARLTVPANKRASPSGSGAASPGWASRSARWSAARSSTGVSWQAIFWLNVPVALVAIPLLLVAVRESRGTWQRAGPDRHLAARGAVFLGIWAIVHGNDDGWTSAGVLGPSWSAALLLPAYVVWARGRRTRCCRCGCSPRGFSVANVIGLTFTIGMFGTVFLLSQYLQVVQHYSPLEAGLRTLPWTAAPMVVAPIAGMLASRTGCGPCC